MGDLQVPNGWNGPAGSANGGVAAGVAARAIGRTAATVRLHRPPPMGTEFTVATDDEGATLHAGDEEVMWVTPAAPPGITLPDLDLLAIDAGGPYPDHPASQCVVCGPQRTDGLGLRPTLLAHPDTAVVADWWVPPAWACTPDVLDDRLQWGVLDCPGALAVMFSEDEPGFAALGTITGALHRSVRRDERVLVLGWVLARDGRKRHCATAIVAEDGTVIGESEQVCVVVPPAWAGG